MPGEWFGPIIPGNTGGSGGGSITLIQNLDGTITVANGAGPTVTVSLPAIVTPGTVGSATQVSQITVDATGRVTVGSNVTIAIAESQVTNLVSDLALKAPLASPALTGVPTAPTAAPGTNTTQLASTAFVTAATGGTTGPFLTVANNLSDVASRGTSRFNIRVPAIASVQAASTTNVSIAAPGASMDGFTFVSSGLDTFLLTGQSTPSQNGPWVWNGAATPATRPNDFPTGGVLTTGRFLIVQNGSANAGTLWWLNVPSAGLTIDTTAETWVSVNILGNTANEAVIRANTLNQMGAPTSSVNWNNQSITQLASLSMTDGTAGHGSITLGLNAPQQSFFANSGDTQPAVQVGILSSNPSVLLGPGGSTAADVTIARTATATLSLDASGGVLINPSLTTTFTSVPASTLGILVSSSYTLNFANANLGTMVDFKPTILFQQAGNGLGSGTGFNFEPTVKNVVGNAVGIGLFTAIAFNPTFTADTQTIANMGTAIGFIANPATSVANAGVITTMTLQGFRSQASIGASTTIGTLTHFLANNASGSGAVTTQLGFDIGALAKATTNIGIRIAAMTSPVQMSMFTTGPETANLTSNTNVVMTMYHGATNYYLLFAWNDAGTVRYKYFQLNGTGTTWAQGTTLPT